MNDLISRQWLMECVEEGWIKFDTQEDENRFVHLIRDIAPSTQPETSILTVTDAPDSEEIERLVREIKDAPVMALPSAEPEIIRCRDCKFTDEDGPIADGRYWCIIHESFMYFCSDAERRTDG